MGVRTMIFECDNCGCIWDFWKIDDKRIKADLLECPMCERGAEK